MSPPWIERGLKPAHARCTKCNGVSKGFIAKRKKLQTGWCSTCTNRVIFKAYITLAFSQREPEGVLVEVSPTLTLVKP